MLNTGGAEHTVPAQATVATSGGPPSTPATLIMTSGTGSSTLEGLRWIFIALPSFPQSPRALSYITRDDARRLARVPMSVTAPV